MNSWQVGSVKVTRVEERICNTSSAPEQFLRGMRRDVLDHLLLQMPGHYSLEHDRLVVSMHSWVIRTGGKVILVEACCGNHKQRPWAPHFHQLDSPFLANLAAAGLKPEDVDIVLCTHLHTDHVGWNTRLENGRWVPTFPNARYLFSDLEDAHWNPQRRTDLDASRAAVYEDSVLPVVRTGQAQLLEERVHALDDVLSIEPAPGHTPGHVILKLVDGDAGALFCGDVLHHPAQVYRPDWINGFDGNPQQAIDTRKQVLAWCADRQALLFPSHFAAPHVAAIHRKGEGFRLEFAPATLA